MFLLRFYPLSFLPDFVGNLGVKLPVYELPGGLGVEPPQLFAYPPQTRWPGIPWGVSFNPPPLLMMLNRLCVMTMTMNRQMSTPHLFFDNSNPENCYVRVTVVK
jgi:hypothetical protein